jgi:hypothetical protein
LDAIEKSCYERLQEELDALDAAEVEVNGQLLRPSQCYYVELDPLHVLFNTNCPDSLREMVTHIVQRHHSQ